MSSFDSFRSLRMTGARIYILKIQRADVGIGPYEAHKTKPPEVFDFRRFYYFCSSISFAMGQLLW